MLQNFLSRFKVSAQTAGSHKQLNTDRNLHSLFAIGKEVCVFVVPC